MCNQRHLIPSQSLIATMSGCRILIFGLFLVETIWWVNGAAVPTSFGSPQQQLSKDAPDSGRNGSSPASADMKSFSPMEQMRQNSPNVPPPSQPFGIIPNMNMFQMPQANGLPSFVMMPQPPGFRPGMVMMQQTPTPPSPGMMSGPNQQQGQPQLPKREILPMPNSTIVALAPVLNSNITRQNNNTRRETETTTAKPATTVRPSAQEAPLGTDQKESDGSKMKQAPVNPFVIPQQPPQPLPMVQSNPMMQQINPMMQQFNPMMQPFNPMMMNQPLFIDPMGRLMMLVPFDPSRLNPAAQAGFQGPQGPQGPPLPIQIPFGQPQLRPVMPDFSKQPPRMVEISKNGTTSS